MTDKQKSAALILQGHSDYNSLSGLNHELALAFRARGLEPILVDLTDGQQAQSTLTTAFSEYGKERILAAFSFSGMGVQIEDDGQNLWAKLGIPVLTWLLDHPAYFMLRQSYPASCVMRLYNIKDFLNFQRDYVKAPLRSAYCPLGAMSYGKEPKRREPKKGEEPVILFPKSLGKPSVLEERWSYLPAVMQRIIRDTIDHYWGETPRSGSAANSVLAAGDAACIELRNDMPLFCFFIAQVDNYMRGRKSHILAKELLKLPVRIYSKEQPDFDTEGARAMIMNPLTYDKMMDMTHDAAAVINVNPNIDDHMHDRVYSALGCGAMPVTDINPWWREHYPELLPYSYDFRGPTVTAAIERILADPAAASEAGWNAGVRMRAERSMNTVVDEAVEWALMMRYFTFNFTSPVEGFIRHGE